MKKIKSFISIFMSVLFVLSSVTVTATATEYEMYSANIYNMSTNTFQNYDAIKSKEEILVPASDLSSLINMKYNTASDCITYTNERFNRTITITFDGTALCQGQEFKMQIIQVDGKYFVPLEKVLYLANAQWCAIGDMIYVTPTNNTLLDFVDEYIQTLVKNQITQNQLLMNGESELGNAFKTSFAAIFNDFDIRLFIPYFGAKEIIIEDYQNAILQLARDELEFLDEYGSNTINEALQKSQYSEISMSMDVLDTIMDIPEALGQFDQIYSYFKDSEISTKKFSEYNNLLDFSSPEINALSHHINEFSDVLSIVNIIVNVNEIAIRSKTWNEDFLKQITLLTDFEKTGYNKTMANNIQQAASGLLDEHTNTFEASSEKFLEETFNLMGGKLLDLTPAGWFTGMLTTSLSVAKFFDKDFAKTMDALELSNMVEWLIRIEHVALTEMVRDYKTVGEEEQMKTGYSLENLTNLRNTTMLSLRCNLRNSAFIYYLNMALNKDSNWANSEEAQRLVSNILWNYSRIIELTQTQSLDKLLIIEDFDNMYSYDYGLLREKIDVDAVLKESSAGGNALVATDADFANLEALLHSVINCEIGLIYNSTDSDAYQTVLKYLFGDFGLAPLYYHIFNESAEYVWASNSNFDNSPDSKIDPLKKFGRNYSYGVVSADKLDWIIKNIFNVEPDRNRATLYYGDYCTGYYYNNNYYFTCGDGGFIGYAPPEISESVQNGDGSYSVTYDLYYEYDYAEYDGTQEAVCVLKDINGKRQWTFTSIKEASSPSSAGDRSEAYLNIMFGFQDKWNADGTYRHTEYTYHDIDEDGIEELIVHDGHSESDRTYYFYTWQNGNVVDLGTLSAFHSALADGDRKLVLSMGAQGSGIYSDVTISGGSVTEEKVGDYTFPPSPYFGEPIELYPFYY